MIRSWENMSDTTIDSFLPIAEKDQAVIVFNVEGRLDLGEEPLPGRRVFTFSNSQRCDEIITIPIKDRHDQKNAAITRLDMAGVKTNNPCCVVKRSNTHPWCKKSSFKKPILARHQRSRCVI